MSKSRRRMNEIIRYGLLIGVGIILIYPLFWMIGSAFKENRDIFGSLSIFPPSDRVVTTNFSDAWQLTRDHSIWCRDRYIIDARTGFSHSTVSVVP